MPTIAVKCQPLWFPVGGDESLVTPQASTSLLMARWLMPIVADVVNEVDNRRGKKAIRLEAVWADFVPMSSFAINATEVLMLVNPPEIDGTFDERKARQVTLAERMRAELWQHLAENCDHLHLPKWEIEVIPEEASGFGVSPKGEVLYSW